MKEKEVDIERVRELRDIIALARSYGMEVKKVRPMFRNDELLKQSYVLGVEIDTFGHGW